MGATPSCVDLISQKENGDAVSTFTLHFVKTSAQSPNR
jgi:hypothetical protein